MGRCGAFDLVLIQRLRVIVDVGQRRRDRNLARKVGVVGGSPRFRRESARWANDKSRRWRTSSYRQLLLGRLQSMASFFSSSGELRPNSGEVLLALLWE